MLNDFSWTCWVSVCSLGENLYSYLLPVFLSSSFVFRMEVGFLEGFSPCSLASLGVSHSLCACTPGRPFLMLLLTLSDWLLLLGAWCLPAYQWGTIMFSEFLGWASVSGRPCAPEPGHRDISVALHTLTERKPLIVWTQDGFLSFPRRTVFLLLLFSCPRRNGSFPMTWEWPKVLLSRFFCDHPGVSMGSPASW